MECFKINLMILDELMSLEKCNCNRPDCDYFCAENNSSYTEEEVMVIKERVKKLSEHLEKI